MEEMIYIVNQPTDKNRWAGYMCEDKANAKEAFAKLWNEHPELPIYIREFRKDSVYSYVANNYKISNYWSEGVDISPLDL